MEDQTRNELEKMLDQNQPELKKLLEQIRPELSPTPEIARALESISALSSVTADLPGLRAAMAQLSELPSRYLKDQIDLGSIFEQARSQLASASEFARRSSTIANAHAAMEQFRIPQFEFPIFPNLSFPKLPQIDWAATRKAHIDGVIRLADCGWTAPAWMSWPDISTLGNASESEIDDYFLRSYLGSDDGELKSIFTTLLASSEMQRWKNLLEEVFDCIQRSKYRICIPALISILEGFTAESICRTQGTSRRETNVSITLKRAKWHEDDNLTGLLWMSVVVFLDHLFAHSDFESTTPSFINRHWILHGRSPTDWTASDALKLLNALATVHWLFD
jgi:hypothetical protein